MKTNPVVIIKKTKTKPVIEIEKLKTNPPSGGTPGDEILGTIEGEAPLRRVIFEPVSLLDLFGFVRSGHRNNPSLLISDPTCFLVRVESGTLTFNSDLFNSLTAF